MNISDTTDEVDSEVQENLCANIEGAILLLPAEELGYQIPPRGSRGSKDLFVLKNNHFSALRDD